MAKKDNNNNNEEENKEKNENKIWKELEEEIKEISEKEEIPKEEEIKIILPEPEPQHEPELEVIEEVKKIEKKSYLYYMVYDENISLESLIDILKSGNFIVIDIPQKIDVEKFKEFLFRLKDNIDEIGGDIGWIENKKVLLLSPNTIIKL